MVRRALLLCLLIAWMGALGSVVPVSAQPPSPQLLPVDEAATDSEFFMFRARLQAAVARHDVEAIVAMSNPGIRDSFGDSQGAASWRRALTAPKSPVFEKLAETLALGGSFPTPDQFVAPYVYSRWPDGLDAFLYILVAGDRVNVREQPTPSSAVVATISHALVTVGDAGEKNGMSAITLADGRGGFVATRFLRSPVGYRALFSRVAGTWQLMAFVTGD